MAYMPKSATLVEDTTTQSGYMPKSAKPVESNTSQNIGEITKANQSILQQGGVTTPALSPVDLMMRRGDATKPGILDKSVDFLAEVGRGEVLQIADFAGTVDAANELVSKLIPATRTEFFKESKEHLEKYARDIPEGYSIGGMTKGAGQFIGRMPVMAAEFMTPIGVANKLGKAVGLTEKIAGAIASTRKTGQVFSGLQKAEALAKATKTTKYAIGAAERAGTFSMLDALKTYQAKGYDPAALKEGAKNGALAGILWEIIPPAIMASTKPVLTNYLKLVFGDEQFANDYYNNPGKYPNNPFSSPKLKSEAESLYKQSRKESLDTTRRLRQEISTTVDDMTVSNKVSTSLRASERDNALQLLKDEADARISTAKDVRTYNVESGMRGAAIEQSNFQKMVHDDIAAVSNAQADMMSSINKAYGENIGKTIEGILKVNPGASIKYNIVQSRVSEVLKSPECPFNVNTKTGSVTFKNVSDRSMAGMENKRKYLKDLYNGDIRPYSKQGSIGIGKLQELKARAQTTSGQLKNMNDGEGSRFFSELGKALNPAEIASTDPIVGSALKELKAANDAFSSYRRLYERGEQILGYGLDANKNPTMQWNKIISALENPSATNRKFLNEVRNYEKDLPESMRLLPRITKSLDDLAVARDYGMAQVEDMSSTISKQIRQLEIDYREKIEGLKSKNSALTMEEKLDFEKGLRVTTDAKKADLRIAQQKLSDIRESYAEETKNMARTDITRRWMPRTGVTYGVMAAGGLMGIGRGLGAGLGVTALAGATTSPIIATHATKLMKFLAEKGVGGVRKIQEELVNPRLSRSK